MFCHLFRIDNHGYLQREFTFFLCSLYVFYVLLLPVIISGASSTMVNKNGGSTFDLFIISEGKLSVFHHWGTMLALGVFRLFVFFVDVLYRVKVVPLYS